MILNHQRNLEPSWFFEFDVYFDYLKERNFRVDLFSRIIFFNILHGFNFANWLPVDFRKDLFSPIFVWSMFYIFWFFRGCWLVVCGSWNSYPNFSIFQITLFGYKIRHTRLNAYWIPIKRSRFTFFLLCCLSLLIFLISCKIFWHDHR